MDFSASTLGASLLVGGLGTGLFVYGKKQSRVPQLLAGILLMVYPAFLSSALVILLVACAVIGALWLGIRSGM